MKLFTKVLMAGASFAAALALSGAALAATTLTYASNGPENSVRGRAEKLFLDEIEKQTQGRIKIQSFWSNTLVSGNELLKACSDGIADMVFINANFYPKAMPYGNTFMLVPFGPQKGEDVVACYQEAYDTVPALKDEYARHNMIPVYFFATDNNSFTSRKPIGSVEELKGQKARASSRWALAAFKSIGATAVSVPWADCYMALQSGTVDTILTSVESQHRGRLYEVGPYLWVWDKMWLGTPYIISINAKKFKKLSKDDQEAIVRAGKIASEQFAKTFNADTEAEIADMAKKGTTVTHATEQDYAAWMALPAIEENVKTWLAEAEAAGLKDAEANFNAIRDIINKYVAKGK
jgi:TRAP-type C4-dicarboxylate transport system substrate-binding protein